MTTNAFGKRPRSRPTQTPADLAFNIPVLRMLIGRSPRMVTWAPCTLFADGAAYAAMCTDISATGARIRFSENFVPPSRCRIVSAQLGLHREARLSRTNGLDAAYYFAD